MHFFHYHKFENHKDICMHKKVLQTLTNISKINIFQFSIFHFKTLSCQHIVLRNGSQIVKYKD